MARSITLMASLVFFFVLGNIASVSAAPRPTTTGATTTGAPTLIRLDELLAIAPTAHTCDGAPFADECRTAAQAAPWINAGLAQYNLTSAGEMAAVVSLMAYESGDFKYQKNHFPAPGRPGQGTRNMQSAAYNVRYARSIPDLRAPLSAIVPDPAAVDISSLSAASLNAIRQLVLQTDRDDFASAAWFLATQCPAAVREGVRSQGQAGWEAYLTQCIGTTVTDDRRASWLLAVAVLTPRQQTPASAASIAALALAATTAAQPSPDPASDADSYDR
ncbi:MAG: hypothetical protein M1826_003589 [Phylliscum demangeonii]|nr:MAG: hypothetical protein M1826_003589 [Phylliscum demangeonii]